jgi:hypothetical protein
MPATSYPVLVAPEKSTSGWGGRGKRGGGRAIYLVIWKDDEALLLLAYSKSVQSDLSRAQWELARDLVKELTDG